MIIKLKEFITPLRVSFVLAFGIHLILINFLPGLLKIKDIDNSELKINRQLSFSLAVAEGETVNLSNEISRKGRHKTREITEKKTTVGQSKQLDKQEANNLKKNKEKTKIETNNKDEEKEIKSREDKVNKIPKKDKEEKKNKPRTNNEEKKDQSQREMIKNNGQKNQLNDKQELKEEKDSEESSSQNKTKSAKKEVDLTEGSKRGVNPPSLVDYIPPSYPEQLKERGIEGRVILKVLINQQGEVEEVKVEDTSGYQQLDLAAKKTVKNWEFKPGRKNEQRIRTWIQVPIKFKLRG